MNTIEPAIDKSKNIQTNLVKAFGTESPVASLKEMNISRRELLPNDVEIEILFAAFVTQICIQRATIGKELFILQYPDTK